MAYRDWVKQFEEDQKNRSEKQKSSSTAASQGSRQSTPGSSGGGDPLQRLPDYLNKYQAALNPTALNMYPEVQNPNLSKYQEMLKPVTIVDWDASSRKIMQDVLDSRKNWFDDDTYQRQYDRISQLLAQASDWRKKYNGNAEVISYVDSIVAALSEAKGLAFSARQHYSQWDNEEDYQADKKLQQDYEDMLGFNLDAGQKEIDYLKGVYEEWGSQSSNEEDRQKHDQWAAEYGDIDGLEKLISDKTAYLNRSKRLQNFITLSSVNDPTSPNYDPDFDKYSGYKSSVSGTFLGQPLYIDEDYETVNFKKSGYSVAERSRRAAVTGDTS